MEVGELVSRAREIIGGPENDDWKIALTKHAKKYREKAPVLSKILDSAEISGTASQFEESAQEAVAAKERFIQAAGRAISRWSIGNG